MNQGITVQRVTALPGALEPNSFYVIGTTLYMVDAAGNLTTFTSAPVVGQTTLIAGTKAIAIPGLKTTSIVFVQLVTPGSASLTVERQAVPTTDTLTITALLAAHTINAADVSVVNYMAFI